MRNRDVSAMLALALGLAAGGAPAVEVTRSAFGSLPDGRSVESVTLTNAHGLTVRLISLGAGVQSIATPDRGGRSVDVVLGYDSLAGYLSKPQYFGATVGRFANRIAAGRFVLGGRSYQLAANDGPNALHGGTKGFDKQLWSVAEATGGAEGHVTFTLVSPDGDEGYPGRLSVSATYKLNDRNEIALEYRATTDRETLVNLSNHTYFNLAGVTSGRSALDQLLTLPADEFTPVDPTLIPTGEFRRVAGTVFDFRSAKVIGQDLRNGTEQQLLLGRGFDHNWVVSRTRAAVPRLVARLEDPVSGRVLEILSDQPGIQFYSGNFLDGTTVGKAGRIYRQGDAVVLEPQQFPDTPNRPSFGTARLAPGGTYVSRIVYRFSTDPR